MVSALSMTLQNGADDDAAGTDGLKWAEWVLVVIQSPQTSPLIFCQTSERSASINSLPMIQPDLFMPWRHGRRKVSGRVGKHQNRIDKWVTVPVLLTEGRLEKAETFLQQNAVKICFLGQKKHIFTHNPKCLILVHWDSGLERTFPAAFTT